MSIAMSNPPENDSFDIAASIAPELTPLPIPRERGEKLRRGVIELVRRSAMAHRDLITVRREDVAWAVTNPGLRQCALRASGGMRVDLLKVEPDASIPWPQDACAQEILVVEGTLAVRAEGASPIHLSPFNQVVVERSAALCLAAGSAGATLYVRSRTVDLDHLLPNEAQWWIAAQGASIDDAGLPCQWLNFLEGVDVAVLRAHDGVASMLVKIAPGAPLPDHGHILDEDCFMLEGHMFLGDILMRAGDYQLAPIGCQHVGISSDTGGLLYFHGAIPPAASE